jgi:hypothetical protein
VGDLLDMAVALGLTRVSFTIRWRPRWSDGRGLD